MLQVAAVGVTTLKMKCMEYKVLPIVVNVDPKTGTSAEVADQFQKLLNKMLAQGWTYLRLESVTTFVKPDNGCAGLGGKSGYMTSRQIAIFTK